MTEKQFRLVNELGDYHIKDGDDELCYDLCSPSMAKENWNNVVNRLNELAEENQRLKAQLTADIDGVCSLCNHHYLVKDKVMQGFYTGKCEKGHEKASKEAVKYCEDFDLKVKE